MIEKIELETILVVDDVPENIDILTGLLHGKYRVKAALSGEKALQIATSDNPPDLILLDVMMPEMDGFEVCRQLKKNLGEAEIPVIFITALDSVDDKVRGFAEGGVDYITKPIEPAEVLARVQTQLALKKAKAELIRRHSELNLSYQSLKVAEDSRDSLMQMIVHDMRSPLTGILGSLEVFKMLNGEGLDEKGLRLINDANRNLGRLINMVSSLLDINRFEAGQMPLKLERTDLSVTIAEAIKITGNIPSIATLHYFNADDSFFCTYDAEIVRRIIINLIGNAVKFTPREGEVSITVKKITGACEISVKDNGPGIPAEFHQKIFEKFGQAEVRAEQAGASSGIGLAFCKLAVEAHGGNISVESIVGEGSLFTFTLPDVTQ